MAGLKPNWLLPSEQDYLSLEEVEDIVKRFEEAPGLMEAIWEKWEARRFINTLDTLMKLQTERYDNLWDVVGRYQDELKRAEVMAETYKRGRADCERRFEEFVMKFGRGEAA